MVEVGRGEFTFTSRIRILALSDPPVAQLVRIWKGLLYLESKKLPNETQHDFRPGLSTVTALTKVANQIYENTDHKKVSLLTLCDLSKAFDSVSHEILLKKMFVMVVDTFWFKDCSSERIQSVGVREKTSTNLYVSYGVP